MTSLRAAVIGVGNMGRHHARVYDELPGVELVAVCDPDPARLAAMAQQYPRAVGYTSLDALLCGVPFDLASIAAPTRLHYDITAQVLGAGQHALVEKPLTPDVDGCRRLVDLAHGRGLVLATGLIERANGAVLAARYAIRQGYIGRVHRVETHRSGPDIIRPRDTGVIMDLAIHDLDVMRYLLDAEPEGYYAATIGTQRHGHNIEDSAAGVVTFWRGEVLGSIACDWLSTTKTRTLTVYGDGGELWADYQSQECVLVRSPRDEIDIAIVPPAEPLVTELGAFVSAVRGDGRPLATGEDGLIATRMGRRLWEAQWK